MTRYVALLRGVNVGGHRKLPMAALKKCLDDAGYAGVATFIASGNVLFDAKEGKTAALEQKLEALLGAKLDLTTQVFVRSAAEWAALIAANPFPEEAKRAPAQLVLLLLKEPPAAAAVAKTRAASKGPESFEVRGREVYLVYPDGQGQSKLSVAPLGPGTARNWNSVLKLAALAGLKP